MVRNFADYHLAREQPRMVSLSSRIQVSKPARLAAAGCLVFLVYLLYCYHKLPREGGDGGSGEVVDQKEEEDSGLPVMPAKQIRVDVYYEVLCPDSRYFVQHELWPSYQKLGDALDVRLWPYGKATTKKLSGGGFEFQCQHGEVECEGNIWHACTARYVKKQWNKLSMVECMIDDNYNAAAVAETCANANDVSLAKIKTCATGEEGRQLHALAGEDTNLLDPKVSFIPTIKIDGSQGSQKAILKNFLKEVCRVYFDKYEERLKGCS